MDGLEEVTEPEVIQVLADRRVVVGAALPRTRLTPTRAMYEAGVPIVPGTGAGRTQPLDARTCAASRTGKAAWRRVSTRT